MPRAGDTPAIAGSEYLLQLRSALEDPVGHAATFACGGNIALSEYFPSILSSSDEEGNTGSESPAPQQGGGRRLNSQPSQSEEDLATDLSNLSIDPDDDHSEDFAGEDIVTIRWDPTDDTTPASQTKLNFPADHETSKNLTQLIKDMHPTDEGYELTPEFFSCTFNPYTCGIIDLAAQALLPGLVSDSGTAPGKSIEAYLFRLNVHTTRQNMNSDKRRRTKMSRTATTWPGQIGHLIISLPHPHVGGKIIVRCKGARKKAEFSSWEDSNSSRQVISWAAFYGANANCEYDICEVNEGYRVSLVYNLFRVRGNGQMGNSPTADEILDISKVPIYKAVRTLVHDEVGWEEDGGYLGFHCRHAYAHTTNSPNDVFKAPDNLVGIDFLMYRIFKSFGKLEIQFRPVVKDAKYRGADGEEGQEPWPVVGKNYGRAKLRDYGDYGNDPRDLEVFYADWAGEGEIPSQSTDEAGSGSGDGEDGGFVDFNDVHWVNRFRHEEPNIVISGQQEQKDRIVNSCLAMIVKVPPGGVNPKGRRRRRRQKLRSQRPRHEDDDFQPPLERDRSSDEDFVEGSSPAKGVQTQSARGGKRGRGRAHRGSRGGVKHRKAKGKEVA